MTGVMNATLLTGGALAVTQRFDAAATYRLMLEPASRARWARRRCSPRSPSRPGRRRSGRPCASCTREAPRSPRRRAHDCETFGCPVRDGYGMTEVGGGIAVTTLEMERKPGAVGRPMRDTEIGSPPHDRRGEVQVRSPSVMRGYRAARGDGAVLDSDGWLATGDIGFLDDDGYLFLVDRKKELIIRGGYNVYPARSRRRSTAPRRARGRGDRRGRRRLGEEVVALVTPPRGCRSGRRARSRHGRRSASPRTSSAADRLRRRAAEGADRQDPQARDRPRRAMDRRGVW